MFNLYKFENSVKEEKDKEFSLNFSAKLKEKKQSKDYL